MAEKQPPPATRQRLDKWLFFTRLHKSRSIAQKAIESGDVRVNGQRITQPSFSLKPGDIVVVSFDRRDVTVRVLLAGERRGPYEEAKLLYDDLTPPPVPGEKPSAYAQATRERGAGRPTKKERREVDRLKPGIDWVDD
ncbi:ribosome-associated heat shock protein Hsp15 [Pararhizobium capsulatum DSM 1112]|uniref:Ribosome-associated heat shock protein Hsp15 n=1 Tax=Pararhizobium capsulatum DSM 1112 TaxID=1121113 RepID=A0ABU0BIH4_9HYPH|nr:RNA-binding S4 domain-containing protein [Pararhizobium capsulatum]MDQ0318055.1 ribosome-associated heat shock protein Hsp15 [Pararhizobium capsulatum DSM 1112]